MLPSVHFWTLRNISAVDCWDPDLEPDRFRSGYGHTFLELYARLRRVGQIPVSIGPTPPRSSTSLVSSLEELAKWEHQISARMSYGLALAALRCPSAAVIRNDLWTDIKLPDFITREFMPTAASVTHPGQQLALPPLPQRGIVPRAESRGSRLEVIALKSYRQNIPPWIESEDFERRVDHAGFRLRFDTQEDEPNRWHDFSDVDVVLCTQLPTGQRDAEAYVRKPPTKLINAWHAGAIPIITPEIGYLEVSTPNNDVLVASNEDEFIRLLWLLRNASELGVARQWHGTTWR